MKETINGAGKSRLSRLTTTRSDSNGRTELEVRFSSGLDRNDSVSR